MVASRCGLGLALDGVALDLGGAGAAQRVQVTLIVADVLDDKGDDLQAHVGHVAAGDLLHLLAQRRPGPYRSPRPSSVPRMARRWPASVSWATLLIPSAALGEELLGGGVDRRRRRPGS